MPSVVYVWTTSNGPGLGLTMKLGLTARMRSSWTVPSLRARRASTSMRAVDRPLKPIALPSSPPSRVMRQRSTAAPLA